MDSEHYSLVKKQWRAIVYDYDFLLSLDDTGQISVCLTQRQITWLLSNAIYAGWKTRFFSSVNPIDSDYLKDFSASIINRLLTDGCGIMPIDCAEVEACLVDSPTILTINNELSQTLGSGGYSPVNATKPLSDSPNYTTNFEDPIVSPENSCDNCDKNRLWTAISYIIDTFDKRNRAFLDDMFSNIVSIADILQRASQFLPLIQALESTIISQFLYWVVNEAKSGYTNNVDYAFLTSLKCEFFCDSVASDCSINLAAIVNILASRTGSLVDASTIALNDLISTILGHSFSGSEYFYALSWLQVQLAAFGETYDYSQLVEAIVNGAIAATLSPDSAWMILCTDCAPTLSSWTIIFDIANTYTMASCDDIVVRNAFDVLNYIAGKTPVSVLYEQGMYIGSGGLSYSEWHIPFTNSPYVTQEAAYCGYHDPANLSLRRHRIGSNLAYAQNDWNGAPTVFTHTENNNISYLYWRIGVPVSGTVNEVNLYWLRLTGTGDLPIIG